MTAADQELECIVKIYCALILAGTNGGKDKVVDSVRFFEELQREQRERRKESTKEKKKEKCTVSTEEVISKQLEEYVYSTLVSWPKGFSLTEPMIKYAREHGRDPLAHFESFKGWCVAKGMKYKNWPYAWMNWCRPKPWEPGFQGPVAQNKEITGYRRKNK